MWNTDKGFTLIELIIVTALVAVVSLAVYSTFNNGMKLWQQVNKQMPEEDLDIFFDKFSGDLRNAFKFEGIPCLGEGNRLEFATLINSSRLNKRTVGKVIYLYNAQKGILNRQQSDFAQVYRGEEGIIAQSLGNIKSLKFQYYLYDTDTKEFLWQDEWSRQGLPLAVRIELGLGDGAQIKRFTKTVSLMVSG